MGYTVIKLVFFVYYAAMAGFFPYLALFLQRAGLSGVEIGVILAVGPIVGFVFGPIWGSGIDSRGRSREVFITCSVLIAGLAFLYTRVTGFWTFLGLQFFFGVFSSPLVPLMDRVALQLQQTRGLDYGRGRLYGSLGFALMVLLFGQTAGVMGLHVLFYFAAFCLLICAVLGLFLPELSAVTCPRGTGLRVLAANRTFVLFLLTVLILRTGAMGATTYFSLLMDYLGGGEGLIGLAWAGVAFFEIPLFYFSSTLLHRLSVERLLFWTYLATMFQLALYGLAQSPAVVTMIHILHGIVFSSFYVAGINFVQKQVGEGQRTTAQTLFAGAGFGLAGLLGNFFGGTVYHFAGVRVIYIHSALTAGIAALCFGLLVLRRVQPGVKSGEVFLD